MPASIGVNLRVTGNCRQGGRKYMEDFFSVAYQQTEDEKDLEYAFFGIYDGHGGAEAAAFAKEHLMETIIKHKNFWSDNDEDVLRAIKDGYIATHYAMWREQAKWPKTSSGLPSTAGTTASVAFIRRGKIYIGHVGDSGIILGYQEPGTTEWRAKPLTKDHKPENSDEMKRIESCGGKVVAKSGVPRVVWNRPKIGHQGPVRRSTPIDEIPFLAVARSLGDLWSYNSQINQFIVSPDPDCSVLPIDTNIHRCLIFGTDGLYNMLSASMAVHIVQQAERHNECAALSDSINKIWLNPSKLLVERALDRWHATKMRADNTSVVTLMLDPPGPPRAQVLKDRKKNLPESGLKILTRYDGNTSSQDQSPQNICSRSVQTTENTSMENTATPDLTYVSLKPLNPTDIMKLANIIEKSTRDDVNQSEIDDKNEKKMSSQEVVKTSASSSDNSSNFPLKERNFIPKLRESTSFDPREPLRTSTEDLESGKENSSGKNEDNTIQINEISSSNIEESLLEEEGDKNVVVTGQSKSEMGIVKCVLRSSKKDVKNEEFNAKNVVKRKLEGEEIVGTQRKSLRLKYNQKSPGEIKKNEKKVAPCTLAEEKLKKLAEEAEKVKKLTEKCVEPIYIGGATKKLSIAQKILKSKKVGLKKKNSVKNQLTTRKLKLVLENVLSRTTRKASKPKNEIEQAVEEKPKKFGKKMCRSKVTVSGRLSNFKRQSARNASLRSKECIKPAPVKDVKLLKAVIGQEKKTEIKKSNLNKSINNNILLMEDKNRKCKVSEIPNVKRETRSSVGDLGGLRSSAKVCDEMKKCETKENVKKGVLKGVKNSSSKTTVVQTHSLRKNTLKQRIQNKTKSMRVLRKSS